MNDDERELESELLSDPHRMRSDMRLTAMAIKRGYIKRRWDTELSARELTEQFSNGGDGNLKQRAALAILESLVKGNEKQKMSAAHLVVAMEGQNQRDEHVALAAGLEMHRPERIEQSPLEILAAMNATVPHRPESKTGSD